MFLSIIIVNYKTASLVLDCIATIFSQPGYNTNNEIFVVDNDSSDNIESLLQVNYPSVKFLQMGYNAGFARANNAAMNLAKGDAFLLINSDTLVKGNAVEGCFHDLMSGNYFSAGVQLLNEDGTPQISGNFAMVGGLNYLLPLPYLGYFLGYVSKAIGMKKPNVPETNNTTDVDWINGAFLMVKRNAVEMAGKMDEDFFLYAEEAEWCSRIKKFGKLCIYGQYNVVHLQGESAGTAFNSKYKGYKNIFDKKGRQILLSNMVRIRKQFGVGWFIFHLLVNIIEIPIFFFGVIIEILLGKKNHSFKNFIGYCLNLFYILKLTPIIIFNKPHFYKSL